MAFSFFYKGLLQKSWQNKYSLLGNVHCCAVDIVEIRLFTPAFATENVSLHCLSFLYFRKCGWCNSNSQWRTKQRKQNLDVRSCKRKQVPSDVSQREHGQWNRAPARRRGIHFHSKRCWIEGGNNTNWHVFSSVSLNYLYLSEPVTSLHNKTTELETNANMGFSCFELEYSSNANNWMKN